MCFVRGLQLETALQLLAPIKKKKKLNVFAEINTGKYWYSTKASFLILQHFYLIKPCIEVA